MTNFNFSEKLEIPCDGSSYIFVVSWGLSCVDEDNYSWSYTEIVLEILLELPGHLVVEK